MSKSISSMNVFLFVLGFVLHFDLRYVWAFSMSKMECVVHNKRHLCPINIQATKTQERSSAARRRIILWMRGEWESHHLMGTDYWRSFCGRGNKNSGHPFYYRSLTMTEMSSSSDNEEYFSSILTAKDEEIKQLKKQLKTYANESRNKVFLDSSTSDEKLVEYQTYMANYMIKASEDKLKAVSNAEATLKAKYEARIKRIIQSYEVDKAPGTLSSFMKNDALEATSAYENREISEDDIPFSVGPNPQGPEPSLNLYENEEVGNIGKSECFDAFHPMIGGDLPRASMDQPSVYKGRSHIPTKVVSRDDPFKPVSVDGSQSTLLKPPTSAGNTINKIHSATKPSSREILVEGKLKERPAPQALMKSTPDRAPVSDRSNGNSAENSSSNSPVDPATIQRASGRSLKSASRPSFVSNEADEEGVGGSSRNVPLDPATLTQVGGVVPPISSVGPLGPDVCDSLFASVQVSKKLSQAKSPSIVSQDSPVGGVLPPISKAKPLGPDGLYGNAAPSRSTAPISGVVQPEASVVPDRSVPNEN